MTRKTLAALVAVVALMGSGAGVAQAAGGAQVDAICHARPCYDHA